MRSSTLANNVYGGGFVVNQIVCTRQVGCSTATGMRLISYRHQINILGDIVPNWAENEKARQSQVTIRL
jgi:hypothetical protein